VRERGWTLSGSLVIGLLAGALVLIRPAGLLLPLLAVLAAALEGRGHPARRRIASAAVCLVGVAAIVGPWLLRNRVVAGHWALSHQSGASFAYHKVADVVLWSQGRHRERFDAQALDEVRSAIDQRLRHQWQQRFGPLTPQQEQALTWKKLNFGQADGIDPFVASSLLWKVGREMLAGRGRAMAACFMVQGLEMLVFPLGLVLDPPVGQGTAPFSLLGGGHSRTALAAAAVIGSAYAGLAVLAAWNLLAAACRRCWPAHFFTVWLILALVLPILPFEDPRFRLPLVPFLLLLAVSKRSPEQATCERKGKQNQ
jgi:hypothetical protein